jgi:hypothetical protein
MNREDLQAFEEDTKKVVPNFQVLWKTDSKLQKLIGWLIGWFNPSYMTNYITTFYPVVYFPTKEHYERSPSNSFSVLAHERVHLLDTKSSPIWFRVSYLLPQLLLLPFLVSALVVVFFSWKISLVLLAFGLISVCPWPSLGRTRLEKRGYAMTMAISVWMMGDIPPELKKFVKGYFVGWPYYKMSWDPSGIDAWIEKTEQDIKSGALIKDPTYEGVYQFLTSRGLVKP